MRGPNRAKNFRLKTGWDELHSFLSHTELWENIDNFLDSVMIGQKFRTIVVCSFCHL